MIAQAPLTLTPEDNQCVFVWSNRPRSSDKPESGGLGWHVVGRLGTAHTLDSFEAKWKPGFLCTNSDTINVKNNGLDCEVNTSSICLWKGVAMPLGFDTVPCSPDNDTEPALGLLKLCHVLHCLAKRLCVLWYVRESKVEKESRDALQKHDIWSDKSDARNMRSWLLTLNVLS